MDNDIGFVATAITAWHLIGIKSYLLKLREEYNCKPIRGILFIDEHPKNGYLIKKETLNFPNGIVCECIYGAGTDTIISTLSKEKLNTEFIVISPCFADIILCKKIKDKFNVKPKAIIIDEGVGCYDISMLRWAKSVYIDTHEVKAVIHFVIRQTVQNFIRRLYKIPVESFTLYTGKYGAMNENLSAINYYKEYMESQDGDVIPVQKEKYGIIFTNPLEEEGNLSSDDLRIIYSNIVSTVEGCGYSIYFRLHPRETLKDKYDGFDILNANSPSSENLVFRLEPRPSFVIGAHTTSLVTSKIFYNIPAFTIGEILKPYCKTKYCIDLIDKYNANFSRTVNVIKSYSDLEKELETLKEIVK